MFGEVWVSILLFRPRLIGLGNSVIDDHESLTSISVGKKVQVTQQFLSECIFVFVNPIKAQIEYIQLFSCVWGEGNTRLTYCAFTSVHL